MNEERKQVITDLQIRIHDAVAAVNSLVKEAVEKGVQVHLTVVTDETLGNSITYPYRVHKIIAGVLSS